MQLLIVGASSYVVWWTVQQHSKTKIGEHTCSLVTSSFTIPVLISRISACFASLSPYCSAERSVLFAEEASVGVKAFPTTLRRILNMRFLIMIHFQHNYVTASSLGFYLNSQFLYIVDDICPTLGLLFRQVLGQNITVPPNLTKCTVTMRLDGWNKALTTETINQSLGCKIGRNDWSI
ncbi:hypothetical protein BJ742DRAFT_804687 [Cladochytrium replicatum]|nr:hypothetical protein BJ742DRAFT_804687 [Cladochytrium replicatum]